MTFGPPSGAISGIDTLSYLNQNESILVSRIVAQRAPTVRDKKGHSYGQEWIDQSTNNVYFFTNVVGGAAQWQLTAGQSSSITTVNADSGSATPASNAISILGTANQVTTAGSSSTVTLSIPSAFVAPGSITAASGAITATSGNLVLSAAGSKLSIHASTASADSVGTTAAMSGTPGSVSVTSSAVTTSSIILFSRKTTGGTPGNVAISAQSAGSFTLLSTGNETSTFNYLIIN